MAVLCWLAEQETKPEELHLFYAHFTEHSPDTFQFVADGMRFAKKNFENVKLKITRNSVLDYFRNVRKIIPHPMHRSYCSHDLKIDPMKKYCYDNGITVDLVGYVKEELKRRTKRQEQELFLSKQFPIGEFTDEWCFEIVKKHIGWYPKIYDIKDENGKRLFKHNNCLPCKNMYVKDIEAVKEHYPEHFANAMKLSADLDAYWGREEAKFYTAFGRDLGQDSTCEQCKW